MSLGDAGGVGEEVAMTFGDGGGVGTPVVVAAGGGGRYGCGCRDGVCGFEDGERGRMRSAVSAGVGDVDRRRVGTTSICVFTASTGVGVNGEGERLVGAATISLGDGERGRIDAGSSTTGLAGDGERARVGVAASPLSLGEGERSRACASGEDTKGHRTISVISSPFVLRGSAPLIATAGRDAVSARGGGGGTPTVGEEITGLWVTSVATLLLPAAGGAPVAGATGAVLLP